MKGMTRTTKRCPVCDRVKATESDWQAWQDAGGWDRVMPSGVCFRVNDLPGFGRHSIHADDDCESHAVDWRSRALAAERESGRRLKIIADAFRDAKILKRCGMYHGSTITIGPMWDELDSAGMLVEDHQGYQSVKEVTP